jgi:hypothetical protein
VDAGANILTSPAALQAICEIENIMLTHASYPKLCKLDEGDYAADVCATQALSVLEVYYREHTKVDGGRSCVLLDQAHVEVAALLLTADVSRTGFFLGREIVSSGKTSRTRSILQLGGPAEGYTQMPEQFTNDDPQQTKVYDPYWAAIEPLIFAYFGMDDYGDTEQAVSPNGAVKVIFWGQAMGQAAFQDTVTLAAQRPRLLAPLQTSRETF